MITDIAVRNVVEVGSPVVLVDELILYDFTGNVESPHKIVWCRKPFDEMLVGGLKNVLFHVNFPENNGPRNVDDAREIVRKAFMEWYHL